MEKIGHRIKALREELGMSQEDLARMLGYKSKSSINKIELGFQDVPRAKLPAFAKALRTTPEELSGWSDLLGQDEASFSYCLDRQAYLLGWNIERDQEGNVILFHEGKGHEITEDDVKEFEKRMMAYMQFMLSQLEKGEDK